MESTLEHLFNEIIETEKQVEEQRMQVIESLFCSINEFKLHFCYKPCG